MRSIASLSAVALVAAAALSAASASVAVSPMTSLADLVAQPHRRLAGDATCTIYYDYDFQGNDITSVPGASATECCAKCGAQTGCTVFSWTNWNGGTCWLKSQAGTLVSSPGGATAFVTPSATTGQTCAIEAGIDYVGNDIGNVRASASTDCCAKCAQRAGCGAFSWNNDNGGTCYLKSGKGATTPNNNVYSGTVQTASCPTVETNVDYAGNDIGSVAGSGAGDCCTKCAQTSGCGAFTWTNWQGGTCWLKSGKGATSVSSGAVSAVLRYGSPSPTPTTTAPPPPPTTTAPNKCPKYEDAIDYVGNDLADVPGAKVSDCCAPCASRAGCWAFTWSNYNGGTCYLKSGKGATRVSAGLVSATLLGAPTPAPTTFRPIPPRPTTSVPPPSGHVQWKIRSGVLRARSANLGGWLVGEYWMSKASPAWKGVDYDTAMSGEYITMQALGKTQGTAQFEQHRASWITEADIAELAAAGLNSVRVPVGFWIVNDDPAYPATNISAVFAPGALKYLDTLVNSWARAYNIAVMISLHAHQGSQNGNDHSAPQEFTKKNWYTAQANVDNSLQFAAFIAARYKTSEAFLGLNLMNEPSVPTSYDVLLGYYTEAYKRIRATGNDCIIVTSPLVEQQSPDVMQDFMPKPAYYNVWHEFHPYFKWGYEGLNEQQVIEAARGYRSWALDKWNGNPLYLGEWSLGSPEATAPFKDRALLKQYAAVQLEQYAAATSGWAFWAWRNDQELETATTGILSGWSMRQALREGIFTVPST